MLNIYAVHFTQHNFNGERVRTLSSHWLIEARSELDAAMKFGQHFHAVDMYEVHIKYIELHGTVG